MDIKSAEDRSRNMAAIRSKDTKPEIFFRKLLYANGFRYRKNVNYIPGHPDLYLAKYHTAVFVHGCFWHRHKNCKFAYMPKSRQEFWLVKFKNNIARDKEVLRQLTEKNIKCLIIWECTIREMKKSEEVTVKIMAEAKDFIFSPTVYAEL